MKCKVKYIQFMSSKVNESGYNSTDVLDSNSSKSSCHSLFSGLASLNDEQSYSVLLKITSNIIFFTNQLNIVLYKLRSFQIHKQLISLPLNAISVQAVQMFQPFLYERFIQVVSLRIDFWLQRIISNQICWILHIGQVKERYCYKLALFICVISL